MPDASLRAHTVSVSRAQDRFLCNILHGLFWYEACASFHQGWANRTTHQMRPSPNEKHPTSLKCVMAERRFAIGNDATRVTRHVMIPLMIIALWLTLLILDVTQPLPLPLSARGVHACRKWQPRTVPGRSPELLRRKRARPCRSRCQHFACRKSHVGTHHRQLSASRRVGQHSTRMSNS